jgi:hypothetical protein
MIRRAERATAKPGVSLCLKRFDWRTMVTQLEALYRTSAPPVPDERRDRA